MSGRPDPRVGTDLGPYRIEAVIGRGGMGVVYLAADTRLDRKVALKLLSPGLADDEAFRARFLRESRLAASIDDPNIIPVYEAGEVEGTYFLAMRFVDGTDLEARFQSGPLAPATLVHLLGQVASALDAAHEAGLVHRDVKPANILIASGKGADRPEHAYLTDFGLTKHRGSQTGATRAGSFLGTLDYIAPEQVEGKEVDGRADQYALACMAFQCLTGAVPFVRDNDAATLMAHLRDAPPSASGLRAELPTAADGVLARGMAKSPEGRYPSCAAFIAALRQALGVRATDDIAVPGRRRRPRDLVVPVMLLAAAGLAVSVIVAIVVIGGTGDGAAITSPSQDGGVPGSATGGPSSGPDATAFPSKAEADLMAALPADWNDCDRGSYDVLGTFPDRLPAPRASVVCDLDPTEGANSLHIRAFPEMGTGSGTRGTQSALTIELFLHYLNDRIARAPIGDCAAATVAIGRWAIAGRDVGEILCFGESSSGDAVLYWTYEDARVLVKAVNQRGDAAALYEWFEQYARFIAPRSSSP